MAAAPCAQRESRFVIQPREFANSLARRGLEAGSEQAFELFEGETRDFADGVSGVGELLEGFQGDRFSVASYRMGCRRGCGGVDRAVAAFPGAQGVKVETPT